MVMRKEEFDKYIVDASKEYDVDPELIRAVITQESAWNPNAVSSAKAEGLMQLMPATAKSLGVSNSFDPRENIRGGTALLRENLNRYDGDVVQALAAYNAGPTAVDSGAWRSYPETTDYVNRITSAYKPSGVTTDLSQTPDVAMDPVQPRAVPDDFWKPSPSYHPPRVDPEPEEEETPEGMWRLDMPDGDWVAFKDDVSKEEALGRAKKEYPLSFGIVPEPPPPPVEDVNMAEAFLGSVAKAVVTIPSGFASEFALATDNQELFDTAESWREYGGELQESISPSAGMVSSEDVENAWEESAVDGSLLWLEQAGEQLGASLGYFVPALLAGAAATYALPALGLGAMGTASATTILAASRLKTAAAAARSATQLGFYLGSNIERGVGEGLLSTDDYNGFEQLGYAVGSTALDSFSLNVATGRGFVSDKVKKVLGRGTGKLSVGANQAVAKSYLNWMNSIDTDGKINRAVLSALSEVIGETGQQALERAAAGLPVEPRSSR